MILSSLINRILDRDPEKSERLAKYDGKIIQLELLPIALNLYLVIDNNHLNITRECNTPPDATIKVITHKDIEVTGDLIFLQDFKNRLSEIDPDWEEGLAQLVGDPLAHQIGNFFRQANHTQKGFRTQFGRNITEYLQEETDCLPTREEVEDFYKDVDTLYLNTERLEARLNLLQKTEKETP